MTTLPATANPVYDIAIVGGGINGAAIARDAALRGLNVYLCEQDDLAGATSSASSKIIHGGLRYLESYEFSMVRKSLKEREVLLGIAPHLVTPLGFILPHSKVLRPRWLIRLGLFVYDHLYLSKRLAKTRTLDFSGTSAGRPLKNTYKKGFMYSDGWADDVRLVVLTAADAAKHGATIAPRTTCENLKRDGNIWQLTVQEQGGSSQIRAGTVVNATGPWAEKFLKNTDYSQQSQPLTLVKGSHIVVPKLFDHQNAYTLQAPDVRGDGRVVFVFPYEKQFTLIGTTDTPFDGNPAEAASDDDEIQYLCDVVNGYFKKQITPEDAVWTYSGVRPLLSIEKGGGDSPSKLSRDYSLQLNAELGLLSVWGGKLTSHRQLAQEAVDKLCRVLGSNRPCQTATTPLPGGDMAPEDLPTRIRKLQGEHPWLTAATATRVVHAYGTNGEKIFAGKDTLKELGQHFGGGLYQVEVDYLIQNEWAQTADDVLWRRSKLGLHIGLAGQAALKDYIHDYMRDDMKV